MTISANSDNGVIYSLDIDGDEFIVEEFDRTIIPISVLKKQAIEDLPCGVSIEICESCENNCVTIHNTPTFVEKLEDGRVKIVYEELITRKYWDAPVGLKLWMETKRDIISEREANVGDVAVENYDDDGAYISLTYSSVINVSSFDELFVCIDCIYHEIESAADLVLGSPFERIDSCKNENEFTVKVLLPLFRYLGFANVKYNHGNREYGKDITFARRTEFDEYEYFGVQAKFGDVSGGASGDINTLITQAGDAFEMPFYDVYTRKKVNVSKVVIAISGNFTNNAIEKIIEGITDWPLKNNLIFLDGDKINTLIERFRRY